MYKTKELNAFTEAKEKYNALREFERKKIITYLKNKENNNIKVAQTGGMGLSCYTNSGKHKLERSYDLTNWKWVSLRIGEKKILISLQAFDRDNGSGNYHVLMDRIGICVYPRTERRPNYYNLMEVTSLELPLNEKELGELYDLITKRVQS